MTNRVTTLLFLFLGLSLTLPLVASGLEPAPPLPDGGAVLNAPWSLTGLQASGPLSMAWVEDEEAGPCLEVQVGDAPTDPWVAQIHVPLPAAIRAGDRVHVGFWLRTVETRAESGEGRMGVVIEHHTAFTKAIDTVIGAGRGWHRLDLVETSALALDSGTGVLNLRLGYRPQRLRIAGLTATAFAQSVPANLLPVTHFSYQGHEPEAPWRKAAWERIARHREARLQVEVVDAHGAPVVNARIKIEQERQAFSWGTVYSSDMVREDARYRQALLEGGWTLLVEGSLKWGMWENLALRNSSLAARDWVAANGFAIKGHNLIWPGWWRWASGSGTWDYVPREVYDQRHNPEKMRAIIDARIADVVGAWRGKLACWDVVNEPHGNHDIMDVLGEGEVAAWFRRTASLDPAARLVLNEAVTLEWSSAHDTVLRLAAGVRAAGARIDAIGLQCHYSITALTGMDEALATLDKVAAAGLPIQLTEIDVIGGDAQLQADYLRDLCLLSYSHPAVEAAILWGFWEGDHWLPDGALFDRTWHERPLGRAWRELVSGALRTHLSGTTDRAGWSGLVFHGRHRVEVTVGDRTTTATAIVGSEGAKFTIRLP